VEVERLGRLGTPQAQQINRIHVVAEDRGIDGHPAKDLVRHPAHAAEALLIDIAFGAAANADVIVDVRPPYLPRIAVAQPGIGGLDLLAVADQLVEDAVLVADAIADRRNLQRSQRVHETRRQPPQSAVAQPRLLLVADEAVEIDIQAGQRLARGLGNPEIEQVVAHERTGQVFGGQITNGARIRLLVGAHRADPAKQHAVANRVCQRLVAIIERGDFGERPFT
jgi:hypothetical protein